MGSEAWNVFKFAKVLLQNHWLFFACEGTDPLISGNNAINNVCGFLRVFPECEDRCEIASTQNLLGFLLPCKPLRFLFHT